MICFFKIPTPNLKVILKKDNTEFVSKQENSDNIINPMFISFLMTCKSIISIIPDISVK